MYIDHEPLNKRQVPNMCRIFRGDNKKKMPLGRLGTTSLPMHDSDEHVIYRYRIEKIIKYINQEYRVLKKENEVFLEKQHLQTGRKMLRPEISAINSEFLTDDKKNIGFTENILTLDIIKMLATFVKFDILTLIN